jgi:zinc transport system ATP-binding protein
MQHVISSSGDVLLTAENLSKHYRGRQVLREVSFNIHKGERITIIGPNGAGKTTLIRQLIGLERPDGGRVTRAPGLTIGYIPQHFSPPASMPLTVENFLRLTTDSGARLVEECEATGVAYTLKQPLSGLSGGEMRRVLLARALLRRPQLLVLDEPAQGVDVAGQGELYELITRVSAREGAAVLMVSHDLYVVMASMHRVICLNQHICCEGLPQQVGGDPAFRALFGEGLARQLALYHHHHDHRHDLHMQADHTECTHG